MNNSLDERDMCLHTLGVGIFDELKFAHYGNGYEDYYSRESFFLPSNINISTSSLAKEYECKSSK